MDNLNSPPHNKLDLYLVKKI